MEARWYATIVALAKTQHYKPHNTAHILTFSRYSLTVTDQKDLDDESLHVILILSKSLVHWLKFNDPLFPIV